MTSPDVPFLQDSPRAVDNSVGGFFRSLQRVWPLLCLFLLFLACHGQALLPSRQYGYRDASHFYYPLNQRVQMEWQAGRWPLWEPEENGGMPLLGNPTAAVFYPLKVVFFLLPYPAAAKAYILVHQALCWFSLWLLARGLGQSRIAAWLAATTYAFGVPVLYQYCNVIFLIGAAWLPLGLLYGWRWIETGHVRNLAGLALVLALQILGGEPQVGYLTLLCLFGLAFWQSLSDRARARFARLAHPGFILLWFGLLCAGAMLSAQFPMKPRQVRLNGPGLAERLFFSRSFWQLAGWGLVGLWLLSRWRRNWHTNPMPRLFIGLGLAACLGAGLTAVQLLPVMEYNALSVRSAAEGPHDIYPFSVEPYRLLELVWPHAFGVSATANQSWLMLLPPITNHKIWVPSLYHGLPAFLLAAALFGFRRVDPKVKAVSLLLVVSLIGSFGEFVGPLFIWRRIPQLQATIATGPADAAEEAAIRLDGYPRDGGGSLYWLMAEVFPGFRTFRYPAKLLTFTSLCLALLAGMGWDSRHLPAVRRRLRLFMIILAISALAGLLAIAIFKTPWAAWMRAHPSARASAYGPLLVDEAILDTTLSFAQSLAVMAFLALILKRAEARRWAIPAFCALVATDLAWANARHIRLVSQSLFEGKSKVVELIEKAEAAQPTPGGHFRVHRMPIWNPPGWNNSTTDDRVRDFVTWERATIQPKYGITQGIHYTITEGTTELYDYWWFFGPFMRKFTPETAKALGGTVGNELAYHPRRGFDLWNTRYFVVPGYPGDWKSDKRSFASFLADTDPIYPDPALKTSPDRKAELDEWINREDFQIFRNKAYFPRAWAVHEMRTYPTVKGLSRRDRESVMSEMLFQNDPFWFDNGREVFDPRTTAWIDQADQARVRPFMAGRVRSGSSENVQIDLYEPQRVELTATLEKPGIVILADAFYAGWKLTVDGQPQDVIRANRMMRGALVPSGTHKLVYTYEPASFRYGGLISLASLGGVGLVLALFRHKTIRITAP